MLKTGGLAKWAILIRGEQLHRDLKAAAVLNGISLERLVTAILEHMMQDKDGLAKIVEELKRSR